MTFTSTDNPFSIFENGKLKAGTYKIQNLHTDGFVDIHERTKELCCRPVKELGEGRGMVRRYRYPLPVVCVLRLEVGNRTPRGWIHDKEGKHTDAIHRGPCRHMLDNGRRRLNWGNLTSFVRQWSGCKTRVHFPSSLILWLGELKLSMTVSIVTLNMFGQDQSSPIQPGQLTDAAR